MTPDVDSFGFSRNFNVDTYTGSSTSFAEPKIDCVADDWNCEKLFVIDFVLSDAASMISKIIVSPKFEIDLAFKSSRLFWFEAVDGVIFLCSRDATLIFYAAVSLIYLTT